MAPRDAARDGGWRHARSRRRWISSLFRRRAWRVPHFEKMLYDQAQLALAFIEAAQVSAMRSMPRLPKHASLRHPRDDRRSRRLPLGGGCR